MLKKVLNAIQKAKGPVSVRELSQELDTDANALSGMIEYLVHKGKLSVDDGFHADPLTDSGCNCGCNINEIDCPYVAPMPTMYSMRK